MAGRSSARPRGVVAALVSMAVAALVAGCGDGGDPAATPSGVTSSASATASPSETETAATATASPTETSALPPLPDAAKENTPEGAEAFIRYYLEVANLAHTEPRPGLVPQLSSNECLSCQEMEGQVRALESQGQRLKWPPYSVLLMERIGGGPPGVQQFNMNVEVIPNVYLSSVGEQVSQYDRVSLSGVGAAVWEGEQWRIYDMGLQAS